MKNQIYDLKDKNAKMGEKNLKLKKWNFRFGLNLV
jgi:hypothetical protein